MCVFYEAIDDQFISWVSSSGTIAAACMFVRSARSGSAGARIVAARSISCSTEPASFPCLARLPRDFLFLVGEDELIVGEYERNHASFAGEATTSGALSSCGRARNNRDNVHTVRSLAQQGGMGGSTCGHP